MIWYCSYDFLDFGVFDFTNFFFSNMTKSKAERFRVEIEGMPPVRVQEVQAKQLEIVQTARRMQEEGVLSLAIVK